MKKIALPILLIISIPTSALLLAGLAPMWPSIVVLIFSLFLYLILSNNDYLEITYKQFAIKTFKSKIDQITQEALNDLDKKINDLKKEFSDDLQQTKEKLEKDIENAKMMAMIM